MEKLHIQQMEKLVGGRSKFIDGFCTGAGIASLVAPNPFTASVAGACLVREIVHAYK